jgi:hypothetical protein
MFLVVIIALVDLAILMLMRIIAEIIATVLVPILGMVALRAVRMAPIVAAD